METFKKKNRVKDLENMSKRSRSIYSIEHTIEEQEIADALALEKFRIIQGISKETDDELLNSFKLV